MKCKLPALILSVILVFGMLPAIAFAADGNGDGYDMGYSTVIQISGQDKYETDYLIAQELNVKPGTPVVITTGEDFPDALAISGYKSKLLSSSQF